MTNTKRAVLASAVAGLFASACATTPAATSSTSSTAAAQTGVMCAGINSCKGQGSCKGASNSCKGQNGCKGQGVTSADTEQACKDKGGTVAKM